MTIAAAWLLTATALLAAWAAPASAKEWRVDAMEVTLDVQPAGDVLVSENVTFTFEGQFSYVARVIPTDHLAGIDDLQVLHDGVALSEGIAPGTYQVFREGDDLVVQLNVALADTTETWTIRYVAKQAVAYYDDADELVWHVFDADTPVPIGRARVTARLPGAVPAEDMDWAVDTGMDVRSTVTSPAPSIVLFEASSFAPYTKYWIAVGFPKGVVTFTWTPSRLAAAVTPRAGAMLPVIAFLAMLLIWLRRGRDEPAAVYARYTTVPPSDLSPAAAGALLDERVRGRQLFATLADLARRGYLELPSAQAEKDAWSIRRLRSIKDLEGIEGFVADRLFAAGDETVKAPRLESRMGQIAAGFDEVVFKDLLGRGFFAASPDAARREWRGRAYSLVFVLVLITTMLAIVGVGGWGYVALGSVATVAIVLGFSRVMPQRTRAGALEQRSWEAFRNYLEDLTAFADIEAAKDTLDRHLPYAIAFGVEKRWLRRFEGLDVPLSPWLEPVASRPRHRQPDRDEEDERQGEGNEQTAGHGGRQVDRPHRADAGDTPESATLSSTSDGLFSGLERLGRTLISAPSSVGAGSDAFGGSRTTSSGHSSSSSFSGSHSSSGGGGFSSGGGGGGGFRAG